MSDQDYDMPMSPRPEGTAVNGGHIGKMAVEAPPHTHRPKGILELRDRAGTMVGDLARTGTGLTVYNAKLKEVDGDTVRDFKHPVFVPWGAVLYWSTDRKQQPGGL